MVVTLGTCVPYFPDGAQIGRSLLLLLVAKPLTYVFFALCFRYRVSLPRPLSYVRVAGIVALATAVGFLLIAIEGVTRWSMHDGSVDRRTALHWAILVAIRVATWSGLGAFLAGLRGRRLLGWIASAVGIDLAFDMAVSAAFDGSWVESGVAAVLFFCFLYPLYRIGRRPSLKARFLAPHLCRECAYDLSGNVSGVCPECGTPRAVY
jgi:hypothetical protein